MTDIIDYYNSDNTQFKLDQFKIQVRSFFENHPVLNNPKNPIIHSVKARTKNEKHLIGKIDRKGKGEVITLENLFSQVTDLIGIRILHIYFDQFKDIHDIIMNQNESKEWCFHEEPKAYTWDPEMEDLFNKLKIKTERRESYYTSVHYVVKPNNLINSVCCEIQVRTLFEEIWGEIDHTINYPHKTESIACKEQLRVLSKLVSTGTRLADSIFRSHKEFIDK